MQLFIAEKPSLGLAIADGLGIKQKKKGYIICENNNIVTWCVGHLLGLCDPEAYNDKYKKWNIEDLPIIPEKWRLVPNKKTLSQLEIIKGLISDASSLVNGGDPDRSGAYIVDSLIVFLKCKLPVKRVLISDTNIKPVKNALDNMVDNSFTLNLSLSELARSRADWLIGMNLSRLFTCISNSNGGDQLVSVGRIQTPLVALVVNRCKEVNEFVSTPYYGIKGVFKTGNHSLEMQWLSANSLNENTIADFDEKKRLLNKDLASEMIKECKLKKPVVSVVESSKSVSKPPLLFSLAKLQAEANKRFKYPIQKVLDLTQVLYDKQYVTYPRSDCTYLPNDQFNAAKTVVSNVLNNTDFTGLEFNFDDKSPAFNDAKIGAHHAIVPTDKKISDPLTKELNNIYTLICERYLMQFLGNKITEKSVIEVNFGNIPSTFKASGEVLKFSGYSLLEKEKNNTLLPDVSMGDSFEDFKLSISKKLTSPPKLYTEATLLESMTNIAKFVKDENIKKILKETDGLGTEATRANIFETIISREFVKRDKNFIVETQSGKDLIQALPVELTSPDLTAKWEHQLEKIVNNEMTVASFLTEVQDNLSSIIMNNKNSDIRLLKNSHRCPLCNNELINIKGANGGFWGCKGYRDNTCKFTAPDKKGIPELTIKKAVKSKAIHCEKCNGEIVKKKKKAIDLDIDSYFWVHTKQGHNCDNFITDFSKCPKCNEKIIRLFSKGKGFYFWAHSNSKHSCDQFIKDNQGKPNK